MSAIKRLLKIIVLLLLVGLAGYFLFNHFFINVASQMDKKTPEEQQQLLVGSDEYSDLEEVAALKEQLKRLEEGKPPLIEQDLEGSGSDSSGESRGGNPENRDNYPESYSRAPSKQGIENSLRKKMSSLQSEYNGKLNALVGQAKAEYVRLRASDSKVNVKDLANKYMAKGNSLEAQCDARVYAAIAYAENQLAFYNYKSAVPNEARKQYVKVKAQRRKSLMNSIK